MPNELSITTAQSDATQRNALDSVVYLLSGTLKGNAPGVSDADFYWATQNLSAFGQAFEAYLAPPVSIRREQGYDVLEGPSFPGVRIPVRNYPFKHVDTLVEGIADEQWTWENSSATLRVAYLGPEQTPADLVDADYTPLVLDGFLGALQDVTLDGIVLELYNRGARRNQTLTQQIVTPPTSLDGVGDARDIVDMGKTLPIVVGEPEHFYRALAVSVGTRGYTSQELSAGDTLIEINSITSGDALLLARDGSDLQIFIDTRTPVYSIVSGSVSATPQGLITFTINAPGLAADVPRGSFVQQRTMHDFFYRWVVAGHQCGKANILDMEGHISWRLGDGTMVPIDTSIHDIILTLGSASDVHLAENNWDNQLMYLRLAQGSTADPNPPCYYRPAVETGGVVSAQPKFDQTLTADSKINYGTGGTGANNANARDGNASTAMDIAVADGAKTITFNDPPSPFANDDTVASTLHCIVQGGDVEFKDSTGSTTFAVTASAGTFRFTQSSARDFNEVIRITSATAGNVQEVWWEHDLVKTDLDLSRTTDVAISVSGANIGERLIFADLMFRMTPDTDDNSMLDTLRSGATTTPNPLVQTDVSKFDSYHPTPAVAMASLQGFLLGTEGDIIHLDLDSYEVARDRQRLVLESLTSIRWNFVILDRIRSWSEFEREMSLQSRTYMYYGPSGHQMLFMDDNAGFAAATVPADREFRLPGVPGANCLPNSAPLLERTPVSDVRNRVEIQYSPTYIEPGFTGDVVATDSGSVAQFGEQGDPNGVYDFWTMSNPDTYSLDASVSGIADFMAERFAFTRNRFRFTTGWHAHGVDRGSLIDVVFPVGAEVFRSARCEVESITVSPLNAERFEITARGVSGAVPVSFPMPGPPDP